MTNLLKKINFFTVSIQIDGENFKKWKPKDPFFPVYKLLTQRPLLPHQMPS